MKSKIKQLQELYHAASKHSNYQVLPSQLSELFRGEPVEVKSRHEQERLDCILSQIRLSECSILDIGGNTGFFTFECLKAGASRVIYCEGNQEHAQFVTLASTILGYEDDIEVVNRYFTFDNDDQIQKVDVCLLLNVLHHVGDDYGDSELSIDLAKKEILKSLNSMSSLSDTLVFQLGFCWKGDRLQLLFQNGTKKEQIDFITNGVSGYWEVESIHIPEMVDGLIVYNPVSDVNMGRRNDLGEFLNRPLYILRSCM